MSARFYAAWATVVALALLLPVAIPYAIWPPHEGLHIDLAAECGRRAENAAVLGGHPVQSLWPLSNHVYSCEHDEAGVLSYRVEVTARGPYAIPFASASVTTSDSNWHYDDGGAALGFAALLIGAAVTSVPFIFALLQRRIRTMRPATA